jgi:hypothetical protein
MSINGNNCCSTLLCPAPHGACISWAHTSWAYISWACTSRTVHLIGVSHTRASHRRASHWACASRAWNAPYERVSYGRALCACISSAYIHTRTACGVVGFNNRLSSLRLGRIAAGSIAKGHSCILNQRNCIGTHMSYRYSHCTAACCIQSPSE